MTKKIVRYFGGAKALLLAVSLMAVLALALAACGGDSGSSSSSGSGSSGGSGTTVTIKESKGASGDTYTFEPASISINKGDSVSIKNVSDENHDLDEGDAKAAGVDLMIKENETGTATFNNAGSFTLKTNKGATLSVTVK